MNKKNILYYVLEGIVSLLFGIFLFKFGVNTKIYWLALAVVLFFILIFIMYNLYQKIDKKLEKIFLILAIPISITYSLLLAPYRVMDDTAHIVKNIDLSQGNLITAKDSKNKAIVYVPTDINKLDGRSVNSFSSLEKVLNKETDYQNQVKMNSFFCYTVINFPTNYIFSTLGFKIGNIFNLNIYMSMYIAKMFNTLFYLIIGYVIMKLFPFGKLFMLVYLLNPMLLQTVTSISADAFTNLICLFWISYILYLRYGKKKIENKDIGIICFTMLLLATAKFIYFPLLLLLILLKKLFKNEKHKKIIIASVICSLIITAISIYIGLGYDNEFQIVISGNNIDAVKQLKNVITKPWNFIIGVFNAIYKYHEKYFNGFFGRILGDTSIRLIYLSFLMYVVLFIISIFLDHEKPKDKMDQLLIILVTIILTFCIFGVEYLTWNNVGSRLIEGVQGRYFLPFMVLPILLIVDKVKLKFKDNTKLVVGLLCIIHLMNIFVLFRSYM